MSVGLNAGPVTVGDYQDATGKTIYSGRGPVCAKCNQPFKRCVCPPTVEVPGENTTLESPATRQATSLELLAFHASKIVKLLEQLLDRLGKPGAIATPAASEPEIMPIGIAIPGVTEASVPAIDAAAKFAENEAKKAATIERMKGVK